MIETFLKLSPQGKIYVAVSLFFAVATVVGLGYLKEIRDELKKR